MRIYLLAGCTGSGKSPEIKKRTARAKKLFVLDCRDEYGICKKYPGMENDPVLSPNLPTDVNKDKSRYVGNNIELFLEIARFKRNCNIIIEESTVFFFNGTIPKKLADILYAKIHHSNNIFFCFHSIRKIPAAMFDISTDTVVVLFRTTDEEDDVKEKCKVLLPYWKKLKTMPVGAHFNVKIYE